MRMDVQTQVAEISALLEEKLRVRGPTLHAQLRKAGRSLPHGVRRDATFIAQSMTLLDNPKLARMVDKKRFTRAHSNVVRHLQNVNLSQQRTTAAINLIASIAFALLVTAVLVLFVLVQRGFV